METRYPETPFSRDVVPKLTAAYAAAVSLLSEYLEREEVDDIHLIQVPTDETMKPYFEVRVLGRFGQIEASELEASLDEHPLFRAQMLPLGAPSSTSAAPYKVSEHVHAAHPHEPEGPDDHAFKETKAPVRDITHYLSR